MKKILPILLLLIVFFAISSQANAQNTYFTVQNINHRSIPQNAIRLPIAEITIPARNSFRQITSVDVSLVGLLDNDDIGNIWLETDDYRRSLRTQFNNDYTANIRFLSPIRIAKNTEKKLRLLANIEADNPGGSFRININKVNFANTSQKQLLNNKKQTTHQKKNIKTQKHPHIRCQNRRCSWIY